jgi:uronate dehydrogenase
VGGEYTTAEFDAEHFEPPLPRGDIAPGSGAGR